MAIAKVKALKSSRNYRIIKYRLYRDFFRTNLLFTCLGSFLGISLIGTLSSFLFNENDTFFLIGSFGASAVLLYGLPDSPLSKPWNLVVGHLVSAFIGVTTNYIFDPYPTIVAAVAVSAAIFAMQITRSIHPPGGATALIAVIGSAKIKALGYFYLISPVMLGVLILYLAAILLKPLKKGKFKKYPFSSKKLKNK